MQSVNSAQLLNIACLLFLSAALGASSASHPATVIVPVTRIYVSLQSHKLYFRIEVLNLI